MLRTTNKKVKAALVAHVLEKFEPDTYGSDPKNTDALGNLREQIDAMRWGGRSVYQTALDYVEGGSLLVYYGEQREFLAEILEQTDDDHAKYSDDRVFKLYCHLVARTIANLYTEGK